MQLGMKLRRKKEKKKVIEIWKENVWIKKMPTCKDHFNIIRGEIE